MGRGAFSRALMLDLSIAKKGREAFIFKQMIRSRQLETARVEIADYPQVSILLLLIFNG
jgi:hypothetical protein